MPGAATAALLAQAAALARSDATGRALHVLSTGLAKDDLDRTPIAVAFVELVAGIVPGTYHPRLDADLRACLDMPAVDAQRLARVTAALLLRKALPDAHIGGDPLWRAFLTRCINVDPLMEGRLVALRRALLLRSCNGIASGDEPLIAALALQAFAGDYVLPVSAEERAVYDRLSRTAAAAPAFALYRPLTDWDGPLPDVADWPEPARALLTLLVARTRDAPRRERALAAAMPRLVGTKAPAAVSAAVRDQYERFPYPRWQAPPPAAPRPLRDALAPLPGIDADTLPPAPLRVLIAGCGTGYEAIDLARGDPTLAVTAVDLSAASLAYAQRSAAELGVTTISFVQGDLLDLPATGARYDVAISTGVLHHMARPADGLAAIRKVLVPGGLVRLGLYSERARAPVRAAHALIRRMGWAADADGVAALRAHVLALPAGDPLAILRGSDDFYATGGCIDLLFHVHEVAFDLPGVAALLGGAALVPVALEAPPHAIARFRQTYGTAPEPLDWTRWDALEARHPALFAAMYQFWAQASA